MVVMAKAIINMSTVGLFVAIVISGVAFHSAEAADYVVGGASGWQNPPNSTFYADWSSTINFTTGDTLTFNFATGVHDVATVTADAYNNCNTANPLNITNNGPATITLSDTGMHYYICTFSGHCSRGQKLAVNVGGTNNSATPSPPPPPGTTASSPPPPPSSATSIAANFTLMMLVSIAIAIGFM